jgi:hypothetical protein
MEKNGVSTNENKSDGKSERKMINMSFGHDALSALSMVTLRMRRGFVLCDGCLKESVTGLGNTTIFSVDVLCSEMLVLRRKSRVGSTRRLDRACWVCERICVGREMKLVSVQHCLMCSSRSLSLYTNLVSIS